MEKKGRTEKRGGARGGDLLIVLLKSVVLSFLVSVLSVFIVSIFVSCGMLSEKGMGGGVALACVLGTASGGIYGVGRIVKKTLVVGLAIGALMFIVLGVAGILWSGGTVGWGSNSALITGACLCGGGIAGVLGGMRRNR